jgi:hypothetical protein
MAAILKRSQDSLFISFGPGTGSTALEMFLRSQNHNFLNFDLETLFFPEEEYASGGSIDRHCSYMEFNRRTGIRYLNVATGVRDPLQVYYSEYVRIKKRWVLLLDDKNSWLYGERSKSTYNLVYLAKETDCFDQWFHHLMTERKKTNHYLLINADHLENANFYLRCEFMSADFNAVIKSVFDIDLPQSLLRIEYANVTEKDGQALPELNDSTRLLYNELFGHYLAHYMHNR